MISASSAQVGPFLQGVDQKRSRATVFEDPGDFDRKAFLAERGGFEVEEHYHEGGSSNSRLFLPHLQGHFQTVLRAQSHLHHRSRKLPAFSFSKRQTSPGFGPYGNLNLLIVRVNA
jgi:hypothetical protein